MIIITMKTTGDSADILAEARSVKKLLHQIYKDSVRFYKDQFVFLEKEVNFKPTVTSQQITTIICISFQAQSCLHPERKFTLKENDYSDLAYRILNHLMQPWQRHKRR